MIRMSVTLGWSLHVTQFHASSLSGGQYAAAAKSTIASAEDTEYGPEAVATATIETARHTHSVVAAKQRREAMVSWWRVHQLGSWKAVLTNHEVVYDKYTHIMLMIDLFNRTFWRRSVASCAGLTQR